MIMNIKSILFPLLLPYVVFSWTLQSNKLSPCHQYASSTSCLKMNIFSDIGDALTGGKLVPQSSLPYNIPLCGSMSVSGDIRVLAVQERLLSFTGEDFDVYDAQTNERVVQVSGALLHLPGKDKMRIRVGGNNVAELDRKLVATTPTYDIYRSDGSKLGWIEKKQIAFTDTFDVYLEGKGGIGPFKPPPAFRIEGDFIDRNFVMKNTNNEAVAKISKDRLVEFDAFDHYQVQVAPGMDSILVVACLCAIDEEFDEEHKERKKKEQGEGGWFS